MSGRFSEAGVIGDNGPIQRPLVNPRFPATAEGSSQSARRTWLDEAFRQHQQPFFLEVM
jgi:hypothetical protein